MRQIAFQRMEHFSHKFNERKVEAKSTQGNEKKSKKGYRRSKDIQENALDDTYSSL